MSDGTEVLARLRTVARCFREAYCLDTARQVLLVRHGEAMQPHPSQGSFDTGLSELGRAQAESLAQRLTATMGARAVALVSSPLRRAVETATPIGIHLGLDPVVLPDLAEVGHIRGPVARGVSTAPGRVARFTWDEHDPPFRTAVARTVQRTLERFTDPTIIMVTHGGFINAYLASILGLNCDNFTALTHGSVTLVRVRGHQIALDRINDVGHLEMSGVPA